MKQLDIFKKAAKKTNCEFCGVEEFGNKTKSIYATYKHESGEIIKIYGYGINSIKQATDIINKKLRGDIK